MEKSDYDFLNLSNDKEILKLIKDEVLYYSNKLQKINHFNISQERILVLTNEGLYILQKKKLNRKIKYNEIVGITFTNLSQEFIVHNFDIDYDYYFQSSEKNLIICIIAKFYQNQTDLKLKICEVEEKSLKNYVTGKKEKKKDKNYTKMDENYLINTNSLIKEIIRVEKNLKQIWKENLCDSDEENPKKEKTTIIFNKIKDIKSVRVEDFQVLKILGRGAFGKVYLVQYKPITSYTYYAMKSIKKEYLNDINEINSKLVDNQIVQCLDYQFLIGSKLCFTTKERIYFIMNFINGEDLLTCIKINNQIFSENQIRFYAAIIGLSIDYIHNNGNILKDLSLDNIIIDQDGYLKITDFKICQLFNMKNELALMKETSEYLAPEVIKSNECVKESDWWSYGIILYQLLFGIPPFYSNDDTKIREQIIKNELRIPNNNTISNSAKDLLKLLLNKNYKERLGSMNGFDDIKKHSFFQNVNFDDIINRKIIPEYKPYNKDFLKCNENYYEFTYEDLKNSKVIANL